MPDSKLIQQLDLNLLRVFQTLYVEQNMTRTAEVLHITPSAVSHAIKRLSTALDDPLFRRNQNKMLPTPSCRRLAPEIIAMLAGLQQTLQKWHEFDPIQSEHNFRIGMHDALEPSVLPELATRLAQLAPAITFSSISFNRANLEKELASGHIDVALDVPIAVRRSVQYQKLIDNKFMVLLRSNHPLINTLDRKNYLDAEHLNVSNRPSGMTMEDSLFQKLGILRRTSIRCQNYFAAKEILKVSDHLLTVPGMLADQLIDPELESRDVPFKIPKFSTHLYWHSNTEQDTALIWLRAELCSLFN